MTENQKALDGLVKEGAHREIYLPLVAKMKRGAGNKAGSFEASPTQQRNKTHAFTREQEAARMSFMTGINHEEALDAVAKGKGIVVTDLTEMLSIRAQVHQKIMARANIVEKLREFGVKVDTLRAPPGAAPDSVEHLNMAKEAMKRKEGLEEVGLYTIDDPATEGWLFDAEVHDVLGRLLKVTESEESIQSLRKHMGAYTGWWKSVVTTSPGFHVQNTWSNGLTLFHRLGPEAFDPRRWEEAFAATAETIGAGVGMGTDAVRNAVGSNNRLQRVMGKEINGYTLRELADYAHRNGIINEFAAQVGEAPMDAATGRGAGATAFQRVNPFSSRNVVMEGSRQVGTFIESAQRFQLFMGNVKRVAGTGKANAMELEWAKIESKKWLIDYSDVTGFESGVMAPLFPFYTWMRRSVPLAMQQILEDPAAVAVVAKGRAAMQGGNEDKDMPQWLRERGAVLLGDEEGGQTTLTGPSMLRMLDMLPFRFEDGAVPRPVFKGGTEVLEELAGIAHPALRTVVEEAGGRDLFFDRALDEGKGTAPAAMQIFRNSPGMLQILDGAARVWNPEGGMGWSTNSKGRLTMDPRMANLLGEMVPVLDQFSELLNGPRWALDELGVPIEEALESATGAKNEYDGMQEFLRSLGLRLRRFDPEGEKLSRARATAKEAAAMRRKDRTPLPVNEWRDKQRSKYLKIGTYGGAS